MIAGPPEEDGQFYKLDLREKHRRPRRRARPPSLSGASAIQCSRPIELCWRSLRRNHTTVLHAAGVSKSYARRDNVSPARGGIPGASAGPRGKLTNLPSLAGGIRAWRRRKGADSRMRGTPRESIRTAANDDHCAAKERRLKRGEDMCRGGSSNQQQRFY